MKPVTTLLTVFAVVLIGCVKQPASAPVTPPPAKPVPVAPAPSVPLHEQEQKAKPLPKTTMPRKRDKEKDKKIVLGWVEKMMLSGSSHTVKAKLDSGAKTSSIDAEIIKTFKRDGKNYVLYRVMLDDNISETYESRVLRWVRIKKKEGGFLRRPVVKMQFCIGKRELRGEVSLAQRGHFIYPVLIGRNMLEKGNILVDTSRTLLEKPSCKK